MRSTIASLFIGLLGFWLALGDLPLSRGDDGLPPDAMLAKKSGKRPKKKSKPPKIENLSLSGTIEIVQANALKFKTDKSSKSSNGKGGKNAGGQEWIVYPQPNTTVEIDATATLDYLHKGQIIEFTGLLSGDTIAGSVESLTIVPKHGHALGIDGKPGKAKDEGIGGGRIAPPKPIVDPDLDVAADDTTTTTTTTATDAGTSKPKAVAAPTRRTKSSVKTSITAKIVSCNDKALEVEAGSRKIHLTLSDIPTIQVVLDDPRLVAPGAKVAVQGRGYRAKSGNVCQADSLKVTLIEPLAAKKKPTPSSSFKLPEEKEKYDLNASAAKEEDESADGEKQVEIEGEKPVVAPAG